MLFELAGPRAAAIVGWLLVGVLAWPRPLPAQPQDVADAIKIVEELGGEAEIAVVDINLSGQKGLRGIHLRRLQGLSQTVVALNLSATGVGDLDLEYVASFRRLRLLALGKTDVGDVGLKHLSDLRGLEQLAIARTRVTGVGFAHLRHAPALDNLDVSNCPLSEEGLAQIGRLWSLSWLCATRTPIENDWLSGLKDAVNLRFLDVRETRLSGSGGLEWMAERNGITSLHLSDTAVDDQAVPQLLRFPTLQWLAIDGTDITPAGVERLGDCPALQGLTVSKKQLPDPTREALKKKRPRLNIDVN